MSAFVVKRQLTCQNLTWEDWASGGGGGGSLAITRRKSTYQSSIYIYTVKVKSGAVSNSFIL